MKENLKSLFTNIFNLNRWGSKESKSGPGSEKIQTKQLRKELPFLIDKFKISSILDAPCGDFNWMNILKIENYIDKYIGYDIVEELIENNKKKYSNKKINFDCKNIVFDKLENVDLILCRDCLVHIPLEEIKKIIENFKKSDSKYLLLTNYNHIKENKDTNNGHWRPLNLEIEPFNFPKPLFIIDENYTKDGSFPGKKMYLWRISEL